MPEMRGGEKGGGTRGSALILHVVVSLSSVRGPMPLEHSLLIFLYKPLCALPFKFMSCCLSLPVCMDEFDYAM